METKQRSDGSARGELGERTYLKLRELIVTGRLPAGGRAVELDLAERFGVSRTPVRDALARLAREGYLVPVSGRRRTELAVAPLAATDMTELWGIIGALEREAIEHVGMLDADQQHALSASLHEANEQLAAATRARPRDADLISELQTEFHQRFMDRCAGAQLRRIYATVRPHVQRYEWACCSIAEATYGPSIAEHAEIIGAVEQGDAERAGALIDLHWRNAASRTRALMVRAGLAAS